MGIEPLEHLDISRERAAFNAAFLNTLDRAGSVVVRHWLLAINIITALLTLLAFVAPVLLSLGIRLPAQFIYFFYSFMCHQMAQRSYFIFGYQVAQCQRNTAIYAAMFIAGLVFAVWRDRIKPLDWRLYGLLILPMAIDGGTQLFGWRESNWQIRSVTGTLFGSASVWLAYPYVERYVRLLVRTPRERLHRVVIYTKDGCSICDKAKTIVERLGQEYALTIEEVDITTDDELMQRYQYLIPVVQIDGRLAAVSKVSEVWLRRKIDGTG